MSIRQLHHTFEVSNIKSAALLRFDGVDGYDVYNTTPPFRWQGKNWLFGRVERREEWASSTTHLFEEIGVNHFRKVPDAMTYPLEDPFVTVVHGELILGGTTVYKVCGKVTEYHVNFYRGTDLCELTYFTSGPKGMKDIRLIELENGKIGVFSRHRGEYVNQQYHTMAVIGYTEIDNLIRLTPEIIEQARLLPRIFGEGEWGGCNQLHQLSNGCIGVVGHQSWREEMQSGDTHSVYVAIAFTFDPVCWTVDNIRLIAQRNAYPDAPFKKPHVADCVFPSGIVGQRDDAHVQLYCGLGDAYEGVCTIQNPFTH